MQTMEKRGVRVLVPCSEGVTADELPTLMKTANVLTNKQFDHVLVETDIWKSVMEYLPAWSRTMTGYTEPGRRFGSALEYTDSESGLIWTFPVPAEFRKTKNGILVVENFGLERKGKRVIIQANEADVCLINNFPNETEQWYKADQTFGIPYGSPIERSDSARYLWRINKRVGPVARGDYDGYCRGRGVGVDSLPSNRFGVLVEAKDAELSTVQAKLQLAEKIAPDAAAELKRLAETTKPESIENLTELIKLLTGQ
ncbi:Uncharacterised protein [uncultured archaeon]|nr:Uncharacterised protein [uncultured archaeon]